MKREFDDDVPTSLEPLDAAAALGPVTDELGGIWDGDIPLTKGEKNGEDKYTYFSKSCCQVLFKSRCQVLFKKLLEHEQPRSEKRQPQRRPREDRVVRPAPRLRDLQHQSPSIG